jgi:GNAT superfamily N-acetyltransferase
VQADLLAHCSLRVVQPAQCSPVGWVRFINLRGAMLPSISRLFIYFAHSLILNLNRGLRLRLTRPTKNTSGLNLHLIIRQANTGDVPAVRECVVEAFSPYVVRIGKPPAPMLLDFDTHIRSHHIWVAEYMNTVVGTLVQYQTPEGFYVDTVAAFPRLQGHGIGRALLEFAEQEALSRGLDSLYLCTNSKMVENQALYMKIGYVEYERKQVEDYSRVFYRKLL